MKALVSNVFVSPGHGSAVSVGEWIKGLDPTQWLIVTAAGQASTWRDLGFAATVGGGPVPGWIGQAPGRQWLEQVHNTVQAVARTRGVCAEARRLSVSEIVGVLPRDDALMQSWLVARLLKVPLTLLLCDVYRGGRFGFWDVMSRVMEGRMVRAARRLLFIHQGLYDYYAKRYPDADHSGWRTLGHPLDTTWYRQAARAGQAAPRRAGGAARIVFTGSVYHAQVDAVRRLCGVVNAWPAGSARFEMYTHSPPQYLASIGIAGRNVIVDKVPRAEVPRVQSEADLLYLPLAFGSPRPAVVETALPTKYVEYLAAGVPILVLAPPWSWLAHLASEKGFACVVDRDDPKLLEGALRRVLDDEALRLELVARAAAHLREHAASATIERFAQILAM